MLAIPGGPGFDSGYLRAAVSGARARGLVLCDTGASRQPIDDPDPAPHLRDRAPAEVVAIAEAFWGGDRSLLDEFKREVYPYYAAPEHMDVPNALFAHSTYSLEVAAHFAATIRPTYDVRPRLREITAPTLVVHGSEDWVVPRERARELAREIPNATLAWIDNAGHFPYAEGPDAFRRALRH